MNKLNTDRKCKQSNKQKTNTYMHKASINGNGNITVCISRPYIYLLICVNSATETQLSLYYQYGPQIGSNFYISRGSPV